MKHVTLKVNFNELNVYIKGHDRDFWWNLTDPSFKFVKFAYYVIVYIRICMHGYLQAMCSNFLALIKRWAL